MTDYDSLRKQNPKVSEAYWELMENRDTIRAELDALKGGLAYLTGQYKALGEAVPVEKLQELLTPTEQDPAGLAELRAAVFPTEPHGPGCPPGCCGAGVKQWR